MFSQSLAYGLGVGQVVLLGAAILCYPPARVQTYTYRPCVVNGSLSRGCGHVKSAWVDLGPPCGVLSLGVASFVISTFSRADGGSLRDDIAFSSAGLEELGQWNAHFWCVVTGFHCVMVFMMCSPVDPVTGLGAGGLMAYALWRICKPADGETGGGASAFGGVVVYLVGAGVAAHGIAAQYSNRYALTGLLLLFDYVLRLGHVWDRATTMETVANCRVCYACWSGVVVAGIYAAWGDDLVMPSLGGDEDGI